MDTEIKTNTFEVPLYCLGAVMARAEKLNKRARKLGMEQVSLTVGDACEKIVSRDDPNQRGVYINAEMKYARKYTTITVHGLAPVIDGWTLLAVVDGRGETPIVRRVPGAPEDYDLTEFRAADMGRCDHCCMHRTRHDVLILREDATGTVQQVGRNCAADFFRSEDAVAFVKMFSLFAGMSDADYESGWDVPARGEHYLSVDEVLLYAAAVTRTFGFVSAGRARDTYETSTKSRIYENIYMRREAHKEDLVDILPEDRIVVEEIKAWLDEDFFGKNEGARSEFEHNICGVFEYGRTMIRDRNVGYVAWMPNGLKKKKDRDAKKVADMKIAGNSEWIGDTGERINLTAKLITKRFFDNSFGGSHLCRFMTPEGNSVVWWATNDPDVNEGSTYDLTGTVKKLDEFKGRKETVLTRVRVT